MRVDIDLINILEAETLAVPALLGYSWDITDNLNYWYKAGSNGILLVAHLDTITRCNSPRNKQPRPFNLCEAHGLIFAENSVLGADDRAGVYAIKKILESGIDCSVLFTNFEEAGGIGVKTFIKDHPEALKGHTLFIEIDRKGIDQFTHYMNDIDPALESLANDFNFNYELGSYSDVSDLSNHYKIPHLNLSAGYYNEHTPSEYLDYTVLSGVLIPRYIDLVESATGVKYSYIETVKSKYSNSWDNFYDSWDSLGSWNTQEDYTSFDIKDLERKILDGSASYKDKKEYACVTGWSLDYILNTF